MVSPTMADYLPKSSAGYTREQALMLMELFPEAAPMRRRLGNGEDDLNAFFHDTIEFLARIMGSTQAVAQELKARRSQKEAEVSKAVAKAARKSTGVRFVDDERRALAYLEAKALQRIGIERRALEKATASIEKVSTLSKGLLASTTKEEEERWQAEQWQNENYDRSSHPETRAHGSTTRFQGPTTQKPSFSRNSQAGILPQSVVNSNIEGRDDPISYAYHNNPQATHSSRTITQSSEEGRDAPEPALAYLLSSRNQAKSERHDYPEPTETVPSRTVQGGGARAAPHMKHHEIIYLDQQSSPHVAIGTVSEQAAFDKLSDALGYTKEQSEFKATEDSYYFLKDRETMPLTPAVHHRSPTQPMIAMASGSSRTSKYKALRQTRPIKMDAQLPYLPALSNTMSSHSGYLPALSNTTMSSHSGSQTSGSHRSSGSFQRPIYINDPPSSQPVSGRNVLVDIVSCQSFEAVEVAPEKSNVRLSPEYIIDITSTTSFSSGQEEEPAGHTTQSMPSQIQRLQPADRQSTQRFEPSGTIFSAEQTHKMQSGSPSQAMRSIIDITSTTSFSSGQEEESTGHTTQSMPSQLQQLQPADRKSKQLFEPSGTISSAGPTPKMQSGPASQAMRSTLEQLKFSRTAPLLNQSSSTTSKSSSKSITPIPVSLGNSNPSVNKSLATSETQSYSADPTNRSPIALAKSPGEDQSRGSSSTPHRTNPQPQGTVTMVPASRVGSHLLQHTKAPSFRSYPVALSTVNEELTRGNQRQGDTLVRIPNLSAHRPLSSQVTGKFSENEGKNPASQEKSGERPVSIGNPDLSNLSSLAAFSSDACSAERPNRRSDASQDEQHSLQAPTHLSSSDQSSAEERPASCGVSSGDECKPASNEKKSGEGPVSIGNSDLSILFRSAAFSSDVRPIERPDRRSDASQLEHHSLHEPTQLSSSDQSSAEERHPNTSHGVSSGDQYKPASHEKKSGEGLVSIGNPDLSKLFSSAAFSSDGRPMERSNRRSNAKHEHHSLQVPTNLSASDQSSVEERQPPASHEHNRTAAMSAESPAAFLSEGISMAKSTRKFDVGQHKDRSSKAPSHVSANAMSVLGGSIGDSHLSLPQHYSSPAASQSQAAFQRLEKRLPSFAESIGVHDSNSRLHHRRSNPKETQSPAFSNLAVVQQSSATAAGMPTSEARSTSKCSPSNLPAKLSKGVSRNLTAQDSAKMSAPQVTQAFVPDQSSAVSEKLSQKLSATRSAQQSDDQNDSFKKTTRADIDPETRPTKTADNHLSHTSKGSPRSTGSIDPPDAAQSAKKVPREQPHGNDSIATNENSIATLIQSIKENSKLSRSDVRKAPRSDPPECSAEPSDNHFLGSKHDTPDLRGVSAANAPKKAQSIGKDIVSIDSAMAVAEEKRPGTGKDIFSINSVMAVAEETRTGKQGKIQVSGKLCPEQPPTSKAEKRTKTKYSLMNDPPTFITARTGAANVRETNTSDVGMATDGPSDMAKDSKDNHRTREADPTMDPNSVTITGAPSFSEKSLSLHLRPRVQPVQESLGQWVEMPSPDLRRNPSSGDDEASRKDQLLTSYRTEKTHTSLVCSDIMGIEPSEDQSVMSTGTTISSLSTPFDTKPKRPKQRYRQHHRPGGHAIKTSFSPPERISYSSKSSQSQPKWTTNDKDIVLTATKESEYGGGRHRQHRNYQHQPHRYMNTIPDSRSSDSDSTAMEDIIARCQRKLQLQIPQRLEP